MASLLTLAAACRGESPLSSMHFTLAPDLSSCSTMPTCLPRIALCKGVLPNESGLFTSANETKRTTLFKVDETSSNSSTSLDALAKSSTASLNSTGLWKKIYEQSVITYLYLSWEIFEPLFHFQTMLRGVTFAACSLSPLSNGNKISSEHSYNLRLNFVLACFWMKVGPFPWEAPIKSYPPVYYTYLRCAIYAKISFYCLSDSLKWTSST